MKYLQDLHILVLGLGESGLAMARWCAKHGAARVRVWDSRETPPQAGALRESVPSAELFGGELCAASLQGAQLVLKSPGLSPGDARIAALLQAAAQTGIAVQGELDLFARALVDLKAERGYEPKVLAITGTNGKTTTTMLTGLLVERAGKRVAIAGNVGPTMLDTLSELLDKEPVPVVEAQVEAEPVSEDLPSTEDEKEPTEGASEGEIAQEAPSEDEDAPLQLAPPPPATSGKNPPATPTTTPAPAPTIQAGQRRKRSKKSRLISRPVGF